MMLLENLVTRGVSEENTSKSSLTCRVTKQGHLLLAALGLCPHSILGLRVKQLSQLIGKQLGQLFYSDRTVANVVALSDEFS